MPRECSICGRVKGSTLDRCGFPDDSPNAVPLGPIRRCATCGRRACPDCLHESDCCFADSDDHAADPEWAPPGWHIAAVTGGEAETSLAADGMCVSRGERPVISVAYERDKPSASVQP
jgi:hypothetical protein